MPTRNKIYFGLLLLAVLIAISAAIYYVKLSSKTPQQVNEKITNGKLVELTDRSLKIKVLMPSKDGKVATGSMIEEEVNFIINSRTMFYRYSEQAKPTDEYNQEVDKFNQQIKQLSAEGKNIIGMEPPTVYNLETVKPEDIKIGELVSLYADREMVDNPVVTLTKVIVEKRTDSIANLTPPIYREKILGTLQSITANKISLLIDSADPLTASLSKPVTREFVINSAVKIFKQQPKNREQYLEEQRKFNQKIEELIRAGQPIIDLEPPSPDSKKAITLSEMSVGQSVLITAEINGGKVTVLEIDVLPQR